MDFLIGHFTHRSFVKQATALNVYVELLF